jgi:hypothetical protein
LRFFVNNFSVPPTWSVPNPKDQKKVSCGFGSPQLTLRG